MSSGYVRGQLSKALVTAGTHEDEATRQRASAKIAQWKSVLDGMHDGTLTIGSRTPVGGLPSWVTPEVVRGGFATGAAEAGGPLLPHELELAGPGGDRRPIFAYYLSEPGLATLNNMLESGCYRINVPEEAALLVVAWLIRAGHRALAVELVDTLLPFASQLRFAPAPASAPAGNPEIVWRQSVGETRAALANRRPNKRIEAMREALSVWNPLTDEMCELWRETIAEGRVGTVISTEWTVRATASLQRYRTLAATHLRCTKHRKPGESLFVLWSALEAQLAGRPVPSKLLQQTVEAMTRKRGLPGSPALTELRETQRRVAEMPSYEALAGLVNKRLAELPQEAGIDNTDVVLSGIAVPYAIERVVKRAIAASIETLFELGVVPSAEVLASLAPQISASVGASAYQDNDLKLLMAATYGAFRRRRSLLLLNLEHQVRLQELPWVQAVERFRVASSHGRDIAHRALKRLGTLTLLGFPATILPNPMITELAGLSRQARLDIPWVEELAADIFMGNFSPKFTKAAKLAAGLLRGSLYERYYNLDYAAVSETDFALLCGRLAQTGDAGYSVAANGKVIEQAQILTTHNLAALVEAGVEAWWPDLSRACLRAVFRLTRQLQHNPYPLATVKDAAYAWRQMLFFLTLEDDVSGFLSYMHETATAQPQGVRARLAPALTGLVHVASGGRLGESTLRQRFLGWTTDRHWILG